jgi:hypothetical protein
MQMPAAGGVKAISPLLLSLPEGHEYRVIFMQRPLAAGIAGSDAASQENR